MMTTMAPREAIIQTGPSLGNDMTDPAINMLHMDQGLYMSRLPLGFALAFNCGQWRDGRRKGGWGGEYDGECLFNDNSNDNKNNNNNK